MATFTRLGWMAAVLLTAACLGCSSKPAQDTTVKTGESKDQTASADDSAKSIELSDNAEKKTVETRNATRAVADESVRKDELPKKIEVAPHQKAAANQKKPLSSPLAVPPTMPKVVMSEEIRTSCIVGVGDVLPSTDLQGIDGKSHFLKDLVGEKLTVVCFWSGATPRSRLGTVALLEDLVREVVEPFGSKGVQVVVVHVGDTAADAKGDMEKAQATFPCLLDPEGKLFASIAKDRRMPRIYLLDSAGKILWFDVENSRATRENLAQAIKVVLGK